MLIKNLKNQKNKILFNYKKEISEIAKNPNTLKARLNEAWDLMDSFLLLTFYYLSDINYSSD